jgi:hypothetical protein
MFPHSVPEQEPPVGTVASFNYSFASGGGSSSGLLIRSADGWSDSPEPRAHELRTWETLTDLEARNAAVQKRTPGSTAVFTAVQVRIHAVPATDDSTRRLAELEDAVFCAAERVGIRTEGASHTDLVAALAALTGIRGQA